MLYVAKNHYGATDFRSLSKNVLLCMSIKIKNWYEGTWTFLEMSKYPLVIIFFNLCWAHLPNAVYQAIGSLALWFRRKFLKAFNHTWAWQLSWLSDSDVNKLLFPQPMEAPYEIWLWLAQWFLRRRCLKSMFFFPVWVYVKQVTPGVGPFLTLGL